VHITILHHPFRNRASIRDANVRETVERFAGDKEWA
jgi:hypothetical protein